MFNFFKRKIGVVEYDQSKIGSLVFELAEALENRYDNFKETSYYDNSSSRVREFYDMKSGFSFYILETLADTNIVRSVFSKDREISFNKNEQKFLIRTINILDRQKEEEKEEKEKKKERKARESWTGKINI